MRRAGKYTILTAVLAIIFIVLSILCVRMLLGNWEEKLLSRSGRLEYTSPVSVGEKEGDASQAARENRLQMEEIEDIVRVWTQKSLMMVHEPAEGQIAIDESMDEVKSWLSKIGIEEITAGGDGYIHASLNQGQIKGKKSSQQKPGYSFWQVEYIYDEMEATFYVNAVTGRVWEAQVTYYKPWLKEPDADFLNTLIGLTGLKASKERQAAESWENTEEGDGWYGISVSPMKSGYLATGIQDSNLLAVLHYSWIPSAENTTSGAEGSSENEISAEAGSQDGNGTVENSRSAADAEKSEGNVKKSIASMKDLTMITTEAEKIPWLTFRFQLMLQ